MKSNLILYSVLFFNAICCSQKAHMRMDSEISKNGQPRPMLEMQNKRYLENRLYLPCGRRGVGKFYISHKPRETTKNSPTDKRKLSPHYIRTNRGALFLSLAIEMSQLKHIKQLLDKDPVLIYDLDFGRFDALIGFFCNFTTQIAPCASLLSSSLFAVGSEKASQDKLLSIFTDYIKRNNPGVFFTFSTIYNKNQRKECYKHNTVFIYFDKLFCVLTESSELPADVSIMLMSYICDPYYRKFSNVDKLNNLCSAFEKSPWPIKYNIDPYLKDYISLMKTFNTPKLKEIKR